MAKRRKNTRLRRAAALLVALLLIAAIICGYILWSKGYLDGFIPSESTSDEESSGGSSDSTSNEDSSSGSSDSTSDEDSSSGSSESTSDEESSGGADIVTDELSIHFLMLGNKYSGDCTLIKAGDTEILIDAGSRASSAETIAEYVSEYCEDGVLEYVIATHADQDHISGFVGTTKIPGIFDVFECETIIDFPKTNKDTKVYHDYVEKRDAEVESGAVHYTALECWNETDGAKRSYEIADGITMNILYNVFYEEKSSDENNYSVCLLFTQGENHYLFTGDLEEKGEEALVEKNDLPQCKLFKAGHHGSPTSSTEALLSVIRPEIVVVSCCCGYKEYTDNMLNVFPSQAFVDRVAPYTDKIYVPTVYSETAEGGFEAMNGNIVVSSDGGEVTVSCSNNDILFKDTEWFKKYRTWPENGVGAA